MLRQISPTPERREELTLAELDQLAIDNDPVRKLKSTLHRLGSLATRATVDGERQAIDREIAATTRALRQAHRERTIDNVFAKYIPDAAHTRRAERAITLAHDTLCDPPAWVVDHVRHLHDTGQLAATRLDGLVTRVVIAASHLDQHGQLPLEWPRLQLPRVERIVPDVEVPLPTL